MRFFDLFWLLLPAFEVLSAVVELISGAEISDLLHVAIRFYSQQLAIPLSFPFFVLFFWFDPAIEFWFLKLIFHLSLFFFNDIDFIGHSLFLDHGLVLLRLKQQISNGFNLILVLIPPIGLIGLDQIIIVSGLIVSFFFFRLSSFLVDRRIQGQSWFLDNSCDGFK